MTYPGDFGALKLVALMISKSPIFSCSWLMVRCCFSSSPIALVALLRSTSYFSVTIESSEDSRDTTSPLSAAVEYKACCSLNLDCSCAHFLSRRSISACASASFFLVASNSLETSDAPASTVRAL
jgi:hypothetical protein